MTNPRLLARCSCALLLALPVPVCAQLTRAESLTPPESLRWRLGEPQLAVAVSPDGSRVVVSGQNRAVRQWSLDGRELASLASAPGGWSITYSPDGRLIAGCGLDRIIRLWDAQTGREVRHLQGHTQIAWMAAFLPGGRTLLSVGEDSTIRFWDVDSGQETGQLLGHPGPVWCMALSRDGRLLATGGADGSMRIWDITAGRVCRQLESQHGGGVGALAFSPDGRTLGSTGWQDHRLLLWETSTGKIRRQVPHDGGSKFLLFGTDGRTLFTAGNDRAIRIWDLTDSSQWPVLEGHGGAVNGLALLPNTRALVSVSNDQTLRRWDLTGRVGVKARTLPMRQVEACWLALARDDGRAAFDAIASLTTAPQQTVALFRDRIQPIGGPNHARIRQLILETGHHQFSVRQRAVRDLSRLGEEAEGPLREASMLSPSLETRKRCDMLVQRLNAVGPSPDTIRQLRAVEALERIGTPTARELLRAFAGGTPEARLTIEARASLSRLDQEGLARR